MTGRPRSSTTGRSRRTAAGGSHNYRDGLQLPEGPRTFKTLGEGKTRQVVLIERRVATGPLLGHSRSVEPQVER